MNAEILVVEDSEDDFIFLNRAFRRAGLSTPLHPAFDGLDAIDRLSGTGPRPTHVLLDLKLPRKSGLEVLGWLRERPELRQLPVVILTSSREKADMDRARALGIGDYFVKPVSFPELVEVVRAIAGLWNLEQAAD